MKDHQVKNTIALQLLKYCLAGFVILFLILFLLFLAIDDQLQQLFAVLERIGGFSYLGVLDIQISVSFIVISIVTIFAQRNITIYWEDIMQYKLIRPRFTNFNAMACYIFADLIFSIILIFWGSGYVYLTFFFSIILIMLLSLKMLAAFFSQDLIKSELENAYKKDRDDRHKNSEARERYRDHKRKLIEFTLQGIENNEIDLVCENMAFLYKFDENEDALYLLEKTVNENKLYLFSRVAKECQSCFASLQHIQEFDNLCRSIAAKLDEKSAGYIQSVYKSIGEFLFYNDSEKFKAHQNTINNLCDYYRSKGLETLADLIEQDYEKQKQWI